MKIINEDPITITLLNNEIYLDEYCWKCIQDGEVILKDCPECNNKRFILTDDGYSIVELLQRHKDVANS
jgi:hypothetical protein